MGNWIITVACIVVVVLGAWSLVMHAIRAEDKTDRWGDQ